MAVYLGPNEPNQTKCFNLCFEPKWPNTPWLAVCLFQVLHLCLATVIHQSKSVRSLDVQRLDSLCPPSSSAVFKPGEEVDTLAKPCIETGSSYLQRSRMATGDTTIINPVCYCSQEGDKRQQWTKVKTTEVYQKFMQRKRGTHWGKRCAAVVLLWIKKKQERIKSSHHEKSDFHSWDWGNLTQCSISSRHVWESNKLCWTPVVHIC